MNEALKNFISDLVKNMQDNIIATTSVVIGSFVVKTLQEYGIVNLTQDELRSINLATSINAYQQKIEDFRQVYYNNPQSPSAQKFMVAAETLEAEIKNASKELEAIANKNKATIASSPLDTANNIAKNKFAGVLKTFGKTYSIGKLIYDLVKEYPDFENSQNLDEFPTLLSDVIGVIASFENTPAIDQWIIKHGLNPNSWKIFALRSIGVGAILTLEYEILYHGVKLGLTKAGVYDSEWFIGVTDWILDPINGVKIKDPVEFDAVSSVYSLLQANARNTLDENQWKQLFGSDEVRKMDMDRVENVLKESIKIITGKEVTVNTAEQMITAIQENYEAFKGMRGFNLFIIDQEKLSNNYITFRSDSELGIAYRYALKNLNNFVIVSNNVGGIVIDYSKYNQNGELDLYSKDNPNGMTENNIKDRIEMLYHMSSKEINNTAYEDKNKNISITKTYFNNKEGFALPAKQKVAFASDKGDELTGTTGSDRLYGGKSNDVLRSGTFNNGKDDNQSDYLEGGTGFDTYYVGNKDIIFDSDMDGTIYFDAGISASPVNVGVLIQQVTNVWSSEDKQICAYKQDNNDLLITYKDHQVIVRRFFELVQKDNNGEYQGLGITLKTTDVKLPDDFPQNSKTTIEGKAKYNLFQVYYENEEVTIIGRTKLADDGFNVTDHGGDTVYAGVAKKLYATMGPYDDKVYGSINADIIIGNDGNDHLYGSSFVSSTSSLLTDERKEKDQDYIIGGNGSDFIFGVVGNNILIGGETDEYLIKGNYFNLQTAGMNDEARGDWVLGGYGNDLIFGSIKCDFLLGNSGADRINGGASDDVIIGDAFIRPYVKIKQITITGSIQGYEYYPSGVAADYQFRENGWESKKSDSASVPHPDVSKWEVTFNPETNDYTISVPNNTFLNNEHIIKLEEDEEATEHNDYLNGGSGNDLIIGQYGDDSLFGEDGNDYLFGDDNRDKEISGNDYLDGGAGDDYLNGGKGDDRLVAGKGNDKLEGGDGNDLYLFTISDLQNNDTNIIIDSDGKGSIAIDGLLLEILNWESQEENIWTANKMQLQKQGNDLHWTSKATTATIIIKNYKDGDLNLELPPTNTAPYIDQKIDDLSVEINDYFIHTLPENLFKDDDKDDYLILSITLTNGEALPNNLYFDRYNNILSGYFETAGNIELTITAADKKGLTASQNFNINIIDNSNNYNNTPPISNYTNLTHNIITHIPFEQKLPADLFTDIDDDQLSFNIQNLPNGLNFDQATNTISGIATQAEVIETSIQCGDGQDYSYLPYIINIIENRPPQVKEKITQLNTTATQNFNYTIPADLFIDPDGERLNITVNNLPQWLNYNPQTNTISGNAPIESAGKNTFTIIASDNANNSIEHTIQINVNTDNIPNAIYADGLKIGTLKNDLMIGNNQNNTIRGNAGNDIIHGLDGDDEIHGGIGDDNLNGGNGNDKIFGEIGNDSLTGDNGDDRLEGGLGDDAYHFTQGDGQDTIYDLGGTETLHIHKINKNDLYFEQDGNNLIIKFIDTNDQITIQNHYFKFLGNPNAIETIQLDNGETIDIKNNTAPQLNSQVNSKAISLSNLISMDNVFPVDSLQLTTFNANNDSMQYNSQSNFNSLILDELDNNGGIVY